VRPRAADRPFAQIFWRSRASNGRWSAAGTRSAESLQAAIRRGSLPTFRQLASTTSYQFYEQDPGTNYAQSRYLLYYLQERGLLVRFVREVRRHHREDPSGYVTLARVLGERDLTAFEQRWKAYVLTLKFP